MLKSKFKLDICLESAISRGAGSRASEMHSRSLFFFVMLAGVFFWLAFCPSQAQAATATGTIVSSVRDIGTGVNWQVMSWTASTSASSTIELKVRTGTTSDMSSADDWSVCATTTNGVDISAEDCVTDGDRYIQYQAILSADFATATEFVSPELFDVEIGYEGAGILVSSVYNTLADDAVISEVRWTETLPAGTDALLQLRSSADGSSWSDWIGSDGTSADYFTDSSGGDSIPSSLSDGSGEQYLQYRVILDSGGQDFPVLSAITIDYTADVPVITGVSPSFVGSNASGTLEFVISGSGFKSGASVKMVSSGVVIEADESSVSASEITCLIDVGRAFGGLADITVTNPNTAANTWSNFYVNEYRGTYVSRAMDIPNLYFNAFSWTATTSATSSVSFKIRTDSQSDMSGATAWNSCNTVSNSADISANNCVTDGERYIQYQASLAAVYGTSTGWFSPELGEASLGYARYAATGTLVSSPFDTGSNANALSKIFWTETAPAGTDIIFQIRTATDSSGLPGTWSDWFGAYEANGYYRNPGGQGGIYLGQTDGSGDEWMQYRVRLESAGDLSPILSDITIEYGDKQYSETIINDSVILKDGVIFR